MIVAQPDLFSQPGPSHHDDPATSKQAARAVSSATRRRILEAFADGTELTDDEAGERAGVGGYSQRRRCSELRAWKLIEPTGDTRPTAGGSPGRVCRITPAGREALS